MTKDMTSGSTLRHIINFAVPLCMGMLFQQLYSMVDTMIVGKVLGVQQLYDHLVLPGYLQWFFHSNRTGIWCKQRSGIAALCGKQHLAVCVFQHCDHLFCMYFHQKYAGAFENSGGYF